MIEIKMFENKWRLSITNETWEYETKEELLKVISELLDKKDRNGRNVKWKN